MGEICVTLLEICLARGIFESISKNWHQGGRDTHPAELPIKHIQRLETIAHMAEAADMLTAIACGTYLIIILRTTVLSYDCQCKA